MLAACTRLGEAGQGGITFAALICRHTLLPARIWYQLLQSLNPHFLPGDEWKKVMFPLWGGYCFFFF
jgi:hypothetical protein